MDRFQHHIGTDGALQRSLVGRGIEAGIVQHAIRHAVRSIRSIRTRWARSAGRARSVPGQHPTLIQPRIVVIGGAAGISLKLRGVRDRAYHDGKRPISLKLKYARRLRFRLR